MFSRSVFIFSVFMVFSSNAFSQEASEDKKPSKSKNNWLMAKYDQNGDQVISLKEINKKRRSYYTQIDRNQDGLLSFDEYQKVDSLRRQAALSSQFKRLDINNDGVVNSKEYSAYQGDFDRLDLNNDGQITASEMQNIPKPQSLHSAKQTVTKCLWMFCIKRNAKQ